MNYVIRVLDGNGKLRKERIMFYAVRILDNEGNLKNEIKSKMLSQRHWNEFSNNLKPKEKKKNMFNVYREAKNNCALIGLENH